MEQIITTEAARRKGCSRQAIWSAVKAEKIDSVKIGRDFIVLVNEKFSSWSPGKERQQAGRARWSSAKPKPSKKARRTA